MVYMADQGNRVQAITVSRLRRAGIVSVVLDTPIVPCAMMRLHAMSWVEKGAPTPYDAQPPQGFFYLDGDILARIVRCDWTTGQKFPMIAFPSGQEFELRPGSNPDAGGIVHIYGEMDLPLRTTRDHAFEQANAIAEQVGYLARKVGDDGLEVRGQDRDEHFLITYDDVAGHMRDIVPLRTDEAPPIHPGLQLMTQAIREQLPELGANEEAGLDALARVKYFTPDAGWTWYASEFDGEDLLFGLVIGFEIELGYFSLRELQEARGPLDLPIERDLYYEPKSLRELQEQHRRERGE